MVSRRDWPGSYRDIGLIWGDGDGHNGWFPAGVVNGRKLLRAGRRVSFLVGVVGGTTQPEKSQTQVKLLGKEILSQR